jgi:hypothetical protein
MKANSGGTTGTIVPSFSGRDFFRLYGIFYPIDSSAAGFRRIAAQSRRKPGFTFIQIDFSKNYE